MQKVIIVIVSIFLMSCQSTSSNLMVQDTSLSPSHHGTKTFKNLYIEDDGKNIVDYFKMRFFEGYEWADHALLAKNVPTVLVDTLTINQPIEQPTVTWLGHSTFLIQFKDVTILTDPIFSDRASPVIFAGPKRLIPHMMDYNDLPKIDIILISHNHYDHVDSSTLKFLYERNHDTQVYIPLGLDPLMQSFGFKTTNINSMDWWESEPFNSTVDVIALPSQHWSARGISDRLETLWSSWAVKVDDFTLWFAGDTGYNEVQFSKIGQHLGRVDLALIPIGAYAPRSFMKNYHVDPSEAIKIHQDVNATFSIGMHWGTFALTAESPTEPVKLLQQELEKSGLDEQSFVTLKVGQTLTIDR